MDAYRLEEAKTAACRLINVAKRTRDEQREAAKLKAEEAIVRREELIAATATDAAIAIAAALEADRTDLYAVLPVANEDAAFIKAVATILESAGVLVVSLREVTDPHAPSVDQLRANDESDAPIAGLPSMTYYAYLSGEGLSLTDMRKSVCRYYDYTDLTHHYARV